MPPGSKFVVMAADPLLSTNVGKVLDEVLFVKTPIPTGELPGGEAIRETLPVGTPEAEVTFTVKLTVLPCGIVPVAVVVSAVVVVSKLAVCQAVARFATFTDPNPVALSYPATAKKAGLLLLLGSTSTPYWFADDEVLLQFGELPAQATELLPVTVS